MTRFVLGLVISLHLDPLTAEDGPDMEIRGPLSRDEVNAGVEPFLGKLADCYDTLVKTNGDAQGTLMIRLIIQKSGSVKKVGVKKDPVFTDKTFRKCVTKAVKPAVFASKERGSVIKYPLKLFATVGE